MSYEIKHTPTAFGLKVTAHLNGQQVGSADIDKQGLTTTNIHPQHEGKGLDSLMHDHAQKVMGVRLKPAGAGLPAAQQQYWASRMLQPMKKTESDVKIEILDKMMKPFGTLKNGKQFFMQAHHPAHKTFTAQDHAEAAHHLKEAGVAAWQKGHDEDDGFGINHGRSLSIAAKSHAEKAKAMGLPAHNNPPKR